MTKRNEKHPIAYCGASGSFAEQAARAIFPAGTLIPSASFKEAYEKTLRGETGLTLLPLENSYAGEVGATMDLMLSGKLSVTEIVEMRVVQNLVGVKGARLEDVLTVVSHPQALAQCAEYIAAHHFREEIEGNTAFAAKKVAEMGSKEIAAIASKAAAEVYGLDVIAENIAESSENTTRFALLSPLPPAKREGERLILLFTVLDRSGALLEALKIIAAYGFNMKSLHSRPLKDKAWQYYFYAEAEGKGDEDAMLRELADCCSNAKIAGRYLPGVTIE